MTREPRSFINMVTIIGIEKLNIPRDSFLRLVAGCEQLATLHYAVLHVEISRNAIDVNAHTPDGCVCLACGAPITDKIERCLQLTAGSQPQSLLLNLCARCPGI